VITAQLLFFNSDNKLLEKMPFSISEEQLSNSAERDKFLFPFEFNHEIGKI